MSAGHTTQEQLLQGPDISPEMLAYARSQLDEGERLLWVDTTNVEGRMRRLRFLVILSLFMIFFCSGMVLLMDTPSKVLFIVFSVLFWLALPAVVFWGQRRHLRRTIYALTDRRALILSLGNPKKTESYPPEKIEFIAPEMESGDLYFTRVEVADNQWHKHGFLAIADVQKVADLMRATFPDVD